MAYFSIQHAQEDEQEKTYGKVFQSCAVHPLGEGLYRQGVRENNHLCDQEVLRRAQRQNATYSSSCRHQRIINP